MALDFLKSRLAILVFASIVAWAFGMLATYYSATPLPSFFADSTPVSFIAIAVFSFSFLFFGYPSPLIMFLGGMSAGVHVKAFGLDAYSLILSFVCIIAAYSSIRLGDALLNDMVGKGNFKQAMRVSIIMILLFLIISAGIDLSGW